MEPASIQYVNLLLRKSKSLLSILKAADLSATWREEMEPFNSRQRNCPTQRQLPALLCRRTPNRTFETHVVPAQSGIVQNREMPIIHAFLHSFLDPSLHLALGLS